MDDSSGTLVAERTRDLAAPSNADPAVRAGPSLDPPAFGALRRRLVLDHAKWDPQVGDVAALADFPLFIRKKTWRDLAEKAELLAGEALRAEEELLDRPDLHRLLGIPRGVRRALEGGACGGATPAAARVFRFDFHETDEGWRVSEANSDVPGGYTESSSFPALMAPHFPGSRPAGDPAGRVAEALAEVSGGFVALLSAPGYMEDTQVVSYLARRLRAIGCEAHPVSPAHLRWTEGRAGIETAWRAGPVGAIVRFYQAEWLPRFPRRAGWPALFAGGRTPVFNPGSAVLTESKRFPLAWEFLRTAVATWRRLLPETRRPADAPWRRDEGWLVKPAFGNNGDDVAGVGWTEPWAWRRTIWDVRLFSRRWVAQRRFETRPIDTPLGPARPCLGVYVVDGKAAGVYGRLAQKPFVDYAAVDAAVLIEDAAEDDSAAGFPAGREGGPGGGDGRAEG